MESTGDIMKGNWQKFFDISPRNELREELQAFLANRPEFDEKIKIGKSYLNDDENLSGGIVSSRYKDSDRYEMLTARHVFVECETEELALKLERALQAVATEAGFSLIPGSDNYEGSLNGNARNRFIVYITCLKKNLFDCPVCAAVMTLDDMLKHRLEHEAVRTVINTNKLLGKLGLERLPEHLIQSREWTIDHLTSSTCRWCDKKLLNRHALHEHEREHCHNNPDRRDKAKCPTCGMMIGARDLDRHILTHDGMEMWTFETCGVEIRADNRTRHMRNA